MTHVASLPPSGPEDDLIGVILTGLFVMLFVVVIPALVIVSTQAADLLT